MPHHGRAHAARRRAASLRLPGFEVWGEDGRNGSFVAADWDDATYDDVIPHRLRATARLNDDGETVCLVDLIADRPDA